MSDLGTPAMDTTRLFFILILFLSHTAAQQPTTTTTQPGGAVPQPTDAAVSYQPRVAVVVGIFCIMISVALLLLVYTKFCYSASRGELFGGRGEPDRESHQNGLRRQQQPPRLSGVDKTVIESLPFFRFSTLKGSREGLECAVCLSRFEGADLLRLLPKCKHAFHIDCVDRWLEGHSSCPLCRRPVLHEDLNLFTYSTSSRFLLRDPAAPAGEDDLELYVEREPGEEAGGGGLLGSSFRKMGRAVAGKKCKKEVLLPARGHREGEEGEAGGRGGSDWQEQSYHRLKHRIVVSDVVFKNRWSDLNSSDLVSLHSEMLRSLSSRGFFPAAAMVDDAAVNNEEHENYSFSRPDHLSNHALAEDSTTHKIKGDMERKWWLESKAGHMNSAGSPSSSDVTNYHGSTLPRSLDPHANNRAVSEIINISRFADATGRSRADGAAAGSSTSMEEEEEKVRRVWLPIASRTVQYYWSTAREKKRSDSDKSTAGDVIV